MRYIFFIVILCSSFLQAKVLIISADTHKSSQSAKFAFAQKEAKKIDLRLDYRFVSQIKNKKQFLSQYDLVIFDSLRVKHVKKSLEDFSDAISSFKGRVVPMVKDDNPYLKNTTISQRDTLYDYWRNGGVQNIQNMLEYIKYKILDDKQITIDSPKILPMNGIYHPRYNEMVFDSTKEYFEFLGVDIDNNEKPVIAIYFGRNSIVGNILEPIDEAIKLIESKGAIALPFFFKNSSKHDSIGLEFLQHNKKAVADVLLYFFSSIHNVTNKAEEFRELNIPIMHALYYRGGDQKRWEEDEVGIPFGAIASSFVMAESLGLTDSFVVAAQNRVTKEFKSIPYQMESFVSKAMKLAQLQSLDNADKKVAVIYYALGRAKVGASFLNIPKSLEQIFEGFSKHGYSVNDVNSSFLKDEMLETIKVLYDVNLYENVDRMLDENRADLYPYEEYMREFYKLPVHVRTDMIREWGYPLESKMLVYRDDSWYFLIPRVEIGNILIMPQPHPLERVSSIRESNLCICKDDERDWHNPTAPINHSYFATYLYLKNQFKTDAIVHLGTHGTAEWAMGKQRGLSVYDSPLMALSDIPHFYPYIVNNTAETIQVKRRARGVIISHQTPPFGLAGAYNEINEIMELKAQYKTVTQGLMRKKIKEQIITKTVALNIHKDLELSEKEIMSDFHHFWHELEEYIRESTSVAQPLGTHTFGTAYKERHLITTITQMLGKDFLKVANGDDYALKNYTDFNSSRAYKFVKNSIIKKSETKHKELKPFLEDGRHFYKLLTSQKESINLFRALDGEHIEAGTGGGPIRNPQSLPTGVNLVSFDPTKVPTPAAFETGKVLMDDFIKNYHIKNGKYPNKITFNLWGLETVRHHGVLESQLLYAMGVEPVWNKKGKIVGTKIIPYRDLKRPRIDVVISATGLYRDMYPNTIKLIADGVTKISQLKEKYNFLRQNSLEIETDLIKNRDINKSEARYLSTIRIFSSKTGTYGSGVDAIEQTSRWVDDKRIAKNYLEHVGYYFGSDTSRWNEKNIELNLYGKNISGSNAVIFSRTSNLYGLLTSDDPYAHFGSIGMAIRYMDGKTPKTYISNLRDPDNAQIQTTARFMSVELRSRYFHPNWLKEMMQEEYAGAVEISSVLNNFWGWQVVAPDVVRDDQWDEFKYVYIDDKHNLKIVEWFKKNNPQALADMTEKMIEAYRKNYWETDIKNIKDVLELRDELEKAYKTLSYNTKLKEFERKASLGFGLSSLREGETPTLTSVDVESLIKGQKLEKEDNLKITKDNMAYFIFAFLLFILLTGIIYELFKNRTKR